jgi:lipid A 4'-phosphatase
MNRTGLLVALAIAVVVGVLFAIYPQLDLEASAPFFNPTTKRFVLYVGGEHDLLRDLLRDAADGVITAIAAFGVASLAGKLFWPQRRMPLRGRAAVFLVLSLALGPGILANGVLKGYWGRERPMLVAEFGGPGRFTPWWDPRGACRKNCSGAFIGGESAGAFWTFAPAALAPPQWRPLAYGAALAFGASVSVLRMAAGAHFFTDVAFAGVFMFLIAWALHGLLFRWALMRPTDEQIEDWLVRAGEALRRAVRRMAGLTGQKS